MRWLWLLLFAPLAVFAECSITWDASPAGENITEYRLYHNVDGLGFALVPPALSPSATSTTCSAHSISSEVGRIGLTAVNASGESDMATADFDPSSPQGLSIN